MASFYPDRRRALSFGRQKNTSWLYGLLPGQGIDSAHDVMHANDDGAGRLGKQFALLLVHVLLIYEDVHARIGYPAGLRLVDARPPPMGFARSAERPFWK